MLELDAQELALLDEILDTWHSRIPEIQVRQGMLHMKVAAARERAAQEAAVKRDGAAPPNRAARREAAKEARE